MTSHGCESSDTTYITIHPDPVSEINVSVNYDTTNCAPYLDVASNNKGGVEFSIIYLWKKKDRPTKIKDKEICPKYL